MSSNQCIRESAIDRRLTRPPLQNPSLHITASEDTMEIDEVPELPPSGGYEDVVTAVDNFSSYLFAHPTPNQGQKTTAKIVINKMTNHACLPTTTFSDKGSAFKSHVIKKVAAVLGITLKFATTKHVQIIKLLERSYASSKEALKIERGERRSLWHKHVCIALLIYNTSYHASIGCESSREFHGSIHYNVLDLKKGIRPPKKPIPISQSAQDVLEERELIFQDILKNAIQASFK